MASAVLGSTDIFNLGAGFLPQSTSIANSRDIVDVIAGDGDISCQTPFNTEVVASAEYEVCGAPTLSISLGGLTTIGSTVYLIRSVTLSHEAGSAPTVSVEAVAGSGVETQESNSYDISQVIDINDVNGLIDSPSPGSAPLDYEATSVEYTWECEIAEAMGSTGQKAFMVSRTPKLTYTESGTGTLFSSPSDGSDANLVLVDYENSDANQEIDTYSATFTKKLVSV